MRFNAMKRVILFVFSLICVIVCSCEKANSPEPKFVGSWNVVVKSVESEVGVSTQTTREEKGWIFTFDTDGNGTRKKDNSEEDTFRYHYDIDSKTITIIEGCVVFTYDVDFLKENTFQFRSEFKTKKMKEVAIFIGKRRK